MTDAELDHRAEVARLDGNYLALELIRELRAHRAAALTAADVRALEYALDLVRDHGCKCGACRATTAERVLTRLTGGAS